MNFDVKLNALMHLFKINNSKLSRGIGVDASLISRWKSGERKISPNSPHIPMLSNFFLKLNAYQYQREYLDRIIAARLPAGQTLDDASRIHMLTDWLISDEQPEAQPAQQPEKLAQSISLIAGISDLLAGRAGPMSDLAPYPASSPIEPASNPGWQPFVTPGLISNYEIFSGRPGRRQAVLNLLLEVLQSDEKQEIYLTDEDDMHWLTEDESYVALWASLLRQIIEKGHEVTLIHIFSRRVNEIMRMLAYWMPLHLAGRLHSYYYPRYGDRRIRQTFLIVRNRAAIISNTIADFTMNDLTYRYDNHETVEQHLHIFMAHLSQCKPLFIVYNRENAAAFFAFCSESSHKNGSVYNMCNHLNFRLLPASLLQTCLSNENTCPSDWMTAERQSFMERLGNETCIDIIPLTLLDQIQAQSSISLPCCESCSDSAIRLSAKHSIVWLRAVIDVLRLNHNYELYLNPDSSPLERLRVNIYFKENVSVRFSPVNPESKSVITVALNESNVLHSLSYFFEDYIAQIPERYKNRQEVISRLEQLVVALTVQSGSIQTI